MLSLKDKDGKVVKRRDELSKVTENTKKKLYAPNIKVSHNDNPIDTSDIQDVTKDDVVITLRQIDLGKTPGEDGIMTDLPEDVGVVIHKPLSKLFTQCIREGKVPPNFWLGVVILL